MPHLIAAAIIAAACLIVLAVLVAGYRTGRGADAFRAEYRERLAIHEDQRVDRYAYLDDHLDKLTRDGGR